MSLESMNERLDHLASELSDGWNGKGTKAPTPESVKAARMLITALYGDEASEPNIYPLTEGGIGFSWEQSTLGLNVDVTSHDGGNTLVVYPWP